MAKRCYHLHEFLGNETRTREFKQGICLLQEYVGKYVCSYLNTDGGKLFFGVNDDGRIVGITCNQKEEDKHRVTIDQAISQIEPTVLPDRYEVEFVSVLDEKGDLLNDIKVLELSVTKPEDNNTRYYFRNQCYIRRDGGTTKLKPRDIQEMEERTVRKMVEVLDFMVDVLFLAHLDRRSSVLMPRKLDKLQTEQTEQSRVREQILQSQLEQYQHAYQELHAEAQQLPHVPGQNSETQQTLLGKKISQVCSVM